MAPAWTVIPPVPYLGWNPSVGTDAGEENILLGLARVFASLDGWEGQRLRGRGGRGRFLLFMLLLFVITSFDVITV